MPSIPLPLVGGWGSIMTCRFFEKTPEGANEQEEFKICGLGWNHDIAAQKHVARQLCHSQTFSILRGTCMNKTWEYNHLFQWARDGNKFLMRWTDCCISHCGRVNNKARCLLCVLRKAKLVYSWAKKVVHPQGSASQNLHLKCDSIYLGVEGKVHSAQL